jgi:two-component system CheB/CheR fusion protein
LAKTNQRSKDAALELDGPAPAVSTARTDQTPYPTASVHAPSPTIVGIGASAGGLEAFSRLIGNLSPNTGLAYVLVQHLDPRHESVLPELLGRATTVTVVQAADGMKIEADRAYVIPPNVTMTVTDGHLRLVQRPPGESPHLSIDAFLCSLAEVHGPSAIGVILSGAGSDGSRGIEAIKLEGGLTMAQDPATARFDSMPRSAVETGYVDFVLSPEEIGVQLTKIGQHIADTGPLPPSGERPGAGTAEDVNKILAAVRNRSGVDFRGYRRGTVDRRILRRMLLHRHDTHQSYLDYLHDNHEEVDELYNDLLIGVTSFFRDPEAFEVLQREYFPKMLAGHAPDRPIRVWVAGCAGGEETYSIAIALLETLSDAAIDTPIQIFATDLSEKFIAKARAGIYPEGIEASVSPERLRRFFVKEETGYRIRKAVRDLCVFSRHDIVRDPPFAHLDLITCRNVLIYLESSTQQRIFPVFHYALDANGLLLLGTAESLGPAAEMFVALDKRHRIFGRRATGKRAMEIELSVPAFDSSKRRHSRAALVPEASVGELEVEANRVALGQYAPPGVVVNDRLEVLQFRGRTSDFLEHPEGKASLNLLGLVRPELATAMRAVIQAARTSGQRESHKDFVVANGETKHRYSVDVIPFRIASAPGQYFLVNVWRAPTSEATKASRTRERRARSRASDDGSTALRDELESLRRYVHMITEEHEAMTEELRAANEEVLSSNEELQSTNEELETTKEEIQATNEELSTVNEEMRQRNRELSALSGDLANVLTATQIPIVIVGTDLRIRRLTVAANRVMKVITSDAGRPLGDIKLRVQVDDLEAHIAQTIETLEVYTTNVQDDDGRWWELTIRPYQTADRRVDGAVLVFGDVDASTRRGDRMEEISEARGELLTAAESARATAESAKRTAESSNEAKSRFLTAMSHDLRTPLNAIAGYTDLMELGIRGPVSDEQRSDFSRIKRSTRHLLSLINDILNFAKLEAGHVDFRIDNVAVDVIVAEVNEMLMPQFRQKSIVVERVDCSASVRADPDRLRQILVNLLTNAAKFTAHGGRVVLTSAAYDETVTVEVRDTGIGISAESQQRIFEPFVQVDRSLTSVDRDGVGLGLAISRDLARAMNGDLTVESTLGEGSRFLLTLPRTMPAVVPT